MSIFDKWLETKINDYINANSHVYGYWVDDLVDNLFTETAIAGYTVVVKDDPTTTAFMYLPSMRPWMRSAGIAYGDNELDMIHHMAVDRHSQLMFGNRFNDHLVDYTVTDVTVTQRGLYDVVAEGIGQLHQFLGTRWFVTFSLTDEDGLVYKVAVPLYQAVEKAACLFTDGRDSTPEEAEAAQKKLEQRLMALSSTPEEIPDAE